MTQWIALSDRDDPLLRPQADPLLLRGTLVIELSLPLPDGILLDFHAEDGWNRTFSLFHDRTAGLRLLHRQGESLIRPLISGPLRSESQTARLLYHWDAPARTWSLCLETREETIASAFGLNPLPMALSDLTALCRGKTTTRAPEVLWFGVTDGETPPASAPWLGLSTPIPTPNGPVPAGALRPGMRVLTRDGHALPLRAVHRRDLPTRGFFAPIVLRAPFFTRHTDLLVAADQPIAIGGLEVEYLFGEEEVLVEARFLTDGRAAAPDTRRATTTSVSLDLGKPELVEVDGCTLLCAPHSSPNRNPIRTLMGYEAQPLMALLRRLRPALAA